LTASIESALLTIRAEGSTPDKAVPIVTFCCHNVETFEASLPLVIISSRGASYLIDRRGVLAPKWELRLVQAEPLFAFLVQEQSVAVPPIKEGRASGEGVGDGRADRA